MTMSSEQLERSAEESRARLSNKLDELRSRITPGEIVDQLFDFAKDSGGGDFVRNLGTQVRQNPLPVALIGAGMAWLMTGRGRDGSRSANTAGTVDRSFENRAQDAARRAGGALEDAVSSAQQGAAGALDNVAGKVNRLQEKAGRAGGELANKMADATSAIGDAARGVGGAAETMGHRAVTAGKTFSEISAEQPLVLAGLGLALGAALGAAFPGTEAEGRLMGETSEAFQNRAKEAAADVAERAKTVASEAFDAAADAAGKQANEAASRDLPKVQGDEASIAPAAQDPAHTRS
jgi:Protein of unknown function (DUF3618)